MNTKLGLWQSLRPGRQSYGLSSATEWNCCPWTIELAWAKILVSPQTSCCLLEVDVYGHGPLVCCAPIADGLKFTWQTRWWHAEPRPLAPHNFIGSTLVSAGGHDLPRTAPGPSQGMEVWFLALNSLFMLIISGIGCPPSRVKFRIVNTFVRN
jgi:hypothetical protein